MDYFFWMYNKYIDVYYILLILIYTFWYWYYPLDWINVEICILHCRRSRKKAKYMNIHLSPTIMIVRSNQEPAEKCTNTIPLPLNQRVWWWAKPFSLLLCTSGEALCLVFRLLFYLITSWRSGLFPQTAYALLVESSPLTHLRSGLQISSILHPICSEECICK